MEIPADARAPVPGPGEPGAHMDRAAAWLGSALARAGYRDVAYYDVPGGFAVRTAMELVDDQGLGETPPDPQLRFSAALPDEGFLTTRFWSDLLVGHVGRYRVFLFVVIDQPLTYSTDVTDHHLLWVRPSRGLPASRADMPYDAQDHWYALVYEFERPRSAPSANLAASPTDPAVHLQKSGILDALRQPAP